jgi:hypothetical protein
MGTLLSFSFPPLVCMATTWALGQTNFLVPTFFHLKVLRISFFFAHKALGESFKEYLEATLYP